MPRVKADGEKDLSGNAVYFSGAAPAAKVAHVDGKIQRHVKRDNPVARNPDVDCL